MAISAATAATAQTPTTLPLPPLRRDLACASHNQALIMNQPDIEKADMKVIIYFELNLLKLNKLQLLLVGKYTSLPFKQMFVFTKLLEFLNTH